MQSEHYCPVNHFIRQIFAVFNSCFSNFYCTIPKDTTGLIESQIASSAQAAPARFTRAQRGSNRTTGRKHAVAVLGSAALSLAGLAAQAAPAAEDAVVLDELSVEARGGDAANQALPPPTGTIGPPPAPFAGGQIASGGRVGFLGNRSIFDTPFTQANYTEELIRNQQALTVGDVIANTSSVQAVQPPFTAQQNLAIRGFFVNSRDFAFDGLYGISSAYQPALEGIERVEVLSGPGTFLFGFPPSGSAVGVVNLVPKRAADVPLTRVTAQSLSTGNLGGAFDVGRRFGDGNALGIRINGAYRDGATPVDHQSDALGVLTLGLDYRGERLRLSLDAGYEHVGFDSQSNGLTVLPGLRIPRAPNLTLNVQEPWEHSDIEQGFGVVQAEYDLTPKVTLFAAIGGSLATRDHLGSQATITAASGAVVLQSGTISAETRQWTGEAGFRARFQTGPVEHTVAVVTTHYGSDEPFATGIGPRIRSSLYAPVLVPQPYEPRAALQVTGQEDLDSVGVTDTASALDGRIQIIAGGRFQSLKRDYALPRGGFQSRYDKSASTPMAALVVKPWDRLSVYASYAEGFGFGPTPPLGARNTAATIPPVVTSQIETGLKLDLDPVGVTLAFFEIQQPSGILDPRSLIFSLNGEQHNQGVDLAVFGSPADGVRVLAGLTLTDGRLTKTAKGAFDGNVAPGAPATLASLGGEVDLPAWILKDVSLTGRIIHASPQYYDQANTQKIPDWTRLDLGLRYRFTADGTPVIARFNVENVAGARYWGSATSGVLSYGTPRTFLASLSAEF